MTQGFRYLSQQDVMTLGGTQAQAALDDIRDVVTLIRQQQAQMPSETHVTLGGDRGKAYALPASVGGRFNAAGVKWTAHRPDAHDGLPQAMAMTLINRADNGLPLGLVESAALTATRTAAVSALALRHAAPRPVQHVLLLGTGVQAMAHLEMLRQLFPELKQVSWWSRSATVFAPDSENLPWPLIRFSNLQHACAQDAGAVITCTSAAEPLLGTEAIRPGRLVIQVGYHEVAFEAIARATRVVVDLWGDFCETSAKSLFQMYRAGKFSPDRVDADLTHLLLDGWRPAPDDSVYFSSFGLNVFDIALAARVLALAQQQGTGTLLPLFPESFYLD
ncbi:ornithine cyclodeaminase [Rahnella perminowiae]|uniref:ornithine cyclodeaminase n=1 Tax=Rahnella perminowiae TaxID=2816244 RepID=UPI00215BE261|nr:ornithine cyclodeaminase [Rahnella perminowiae]MCR9001281.1 ornithine cyclodeaminase [Rahnella perminowiae]